MPFLRVVTALPFQVSIVFYSPRRVPVPLPRPAPLFFPFFIFLLLLFCFVGGAGMARAQEVVDLYLPKTLKLHIPPYTPPNFMDEAVEWTGMNRTVVSGPGTGLSASVTPDSFYYDHSWISGTRYQYHMTGTRHYWAEETYLDANGTPQTRWVRAEQFITSQPINVTPVLIPVSENQSVDSRYDMRYGDPTFLDHKFNTTAYRGGLFAGFANDPSRVGHGYLKFPLTPSTITGEKLWPVGGLSVWFERLARSGSGTVATQGASSDSWTASTLTWSTAPVLDGTKGPAITLQYDRNHAAGQWVRLNCLKDVETELAGDMGLTLAWTVPVTGVLQLAFTWISAAR